MMHTRYFCLKVNLMLKSFLLFSSFFFSSVTNYCGELISSFFSKYSFVNQVKESIGYPVLLAHLSWKLVKREFSTWIFLLQSSPSTFLLIREQGGLKFSRFSHEIWPFLTSFDQKSSKFHLRNYLFDSYRVFHLKKVRKNGCSTEMVHFWPSVSKTKMCLL